MSRTVFILGAGASKEGGAPLMHDFLEVAEQLRRQNDVGDDARYFDLVRRARIALQNVFAKSFLDIGNVEKVFGAFEMARHIRRLGNLTRQEISELGLAVRRVIATTLERTITYVVTREIVQPPVPYQEFLKLIHDIGSSRVGKVAVITFNYDVALDYAFHFQNTPITYCLSDEDDSSALPVLKLHGTLNWTSCSECSTVIPYDLETYFSTHRWDMSTLREDEYGQFQRANRPPGSLKLEISRNLNLIHHHDRPCQADCVIVPPTWNKAQYHGAIAHVWERAAKELSEAENIVVIGYSLPDADDFFRYLFALGTVGDTLLEHIVVCDVNSKIIERYQQLLAEQVRGLLRPVHATFSNGIIDIRRHLGMS
jgi:hypothetical protein